ncbi:2-isopropylmalate synthase [Halotalea alkalilenta]
MNESRFQPAMGKYRPFDIVALDDRQWPGKRIERAPIWASVDLRDGNQSLIDPMDGERKWRFFELLVSLGFKQIEVGFPSASQTDFDFLRELIEGQRVPNDVTLQVLTPARAPLIRRTFEALSGAKRAIVHLYNATSPLFRETVLGLDRDGCKRLAVEHTALVRRLMEEHPGTDWTFQYSPEHFTTTELDFSLEVCEAVLDTFGASPERRVILNLPATVEVATANVYADQVEWFCRHLRVRERAIISLHPHNDRGTGIAAAELGLMAGADRIEGTLFGNGERTGNVDIVTLAMNLFIQGIDPELDLSNLTPVMREVEHCNQLPVHPRHPYVGDLVFTAFSGSHQDAIKKGMASHRASLASGGTPLWDVPYLPVDPLDVGRNYEAVIRVNSQSGKGGISYLLEQDHGIALPRRLAIEFSQVVQEIADRTGREITSQMIHRAFLDEYRLDAPYRLLRQRIEERDGEVAIAAEIEGPQGGLSVSGRGNGPLSALVHGLRGQGFDIDVIDYHENSRGQGADAEAIAFVELRAAGRPVFGVGLHVNTTTATLIAALSALSRAMRQDEVEGVALSV